MSTRLSALALTALITLTAASEAAAAPPSKRIGDTSDTPIQQIIQQSEPAEAPQVPFTPPTAGIARLPERGKPLSVPGAAAAQAHSAARADAAKRKKKNKKKKKRVAQNGKWHGAYNANPNLQVGRLFFDQKPGPGEDWTHCSATAINSENRSLVATAGHCVYDSFTGWSESMMFCPGYERSCKLGVWHARTAYTTNAWFAATDFNEDMAVVLVSPNEQGYLVDVVGGQGITFNQNVGLARHAFGYPASDSRWPAYRYNGEDLIYCPGTDYYAAGSIVIPCTMTGGSSGGPWISSFDASGLGYVNGINSNKPGPRRTGAKIMASPYLGEAEAQLFQYTRGI
jgi:V8-like Glu-specific endopeptidase